MSRRSSAGSSLRGGLTGDRHLVPREQLGGELHVGEAVGWIVIGLKAPDAVAARGDTSTRNRCPAGAVRPAAARRRDWLRASPISSPGSTAPVNRRWPPFMLPRTRRCPPRWSSACWGRDVACPCSSSTPMFMPGRAVGLGKDVVGPDLLLPKRVVDQPQRLRSPGPARRRGYRRPPTKSNQWKLRTTGCSNVAIGPLRKAGARPQAQDAKAAS